MRHEKYIFKLTQRTQLNSFLVIVKMNLFLLLHCSGCLNLYIHYSKILKSNMPLKAQSLKAVATRLSSCNTQIHTHPCIFHYFIKLKFCIGAIHTAVDPSHIWNRMRIKLSESVSVVLSQLNLCHSTIIKTLLIRMPC